MLSFAAAGTSRNSRAHTFHYKFKPFGVGLFHRHRADLTSGMNSTARSLDNQQRRLNYRVVLGFGDAICSIRVPYIEWSVTLTLETRRLTCAVYPAGTAL